MRGTAMLYQLDNSRISDTLAAQIPTPNDTDLLQKAPWNRSTKPGRKWVTSLHGCHLSQTRISHPGSDHDHQITPEQIRCAAIDTDEQNASIHSVSRARGGPNVTVRHTPVELPKSKWGYFQNRAWTRNGNSAVRIVNTYLGHNEFGRSASVVLPGPPGFFPEFPCPFCPDLSLSILAWRVHPYCPIDSLDNAPHCRWSHKPEHRCGVLQCPFRVDVQRTEKEENASNLWQVRKSDMRLLMNHSQQATARR